MTNMMILYGAICISVLPFLWLFTQIHVVGNFSYAFGNIAGYIGAVLLFWECILGNRELQKKWNMQKGELIKTHIVLGVWGMFFVLIHPILELMVYAEHISFLFFPDISTTFDLHITAGRIAFLLVLMVWLTSSLMRRSVSYRAWFVIHLFSYPMMFFVFFHAFEVGTYLNTFFFIKLYWIALLLSYSGFVTWRIYELRVKHDTTHQSL